MGAPFAKSRFVRSLGVSSAIHGALLAVAASLWTLPAARARARGRTVPHQVTVALAPLTRPPAAPAARPPETTDLLPDEPLEEPLPTLIEELPPIEPFEEPLFERPELSQATLRPRALARLSPPRSKTAQTNEEKTPAAPREEPIAQEFTSHYLPPAAPPAGIPDPILTKPTPLDNPPPPYPARAVARGIEGTVQLTLSISADGRVTGVELDVSSGSALLDRAALAAVRRWRFRPGERDGVPQAMELPWRVVFTLTP